MNVKHDKDRLGTFAQASGSKRKSYYLTKEDKPEAEKRAGKVRNEHPDLLFDNLKTDRMVMMFDYFCQESSSKLITKLVGMDSKSSDDVTLFINSEGGEVDSLQAILDTIGAMRSKVNTVCLGMAASCGAALYSAGNRRYIGPRSRVLIHEPAGGAWGSTSRIAEKLAAFKLLEDKLLGEVADNSGQTREFVRSIVRNTDVILDADESIAFGISDGIMICKDTNKLESKIAAYASANRGGEPEFNRLVSIVVKYCHDNEGEEKPMDLKEILEKLKNEHRIDVNELQNKVTGVSDILTMNAALEAEKATMKVKISSLTDRLVAAEKESSNIKMDALLNSLIDAGKATQATNKINRAAFTAVGYDQAVEMVKDMPILAKMEPTAAPVLDQPVKPTSRGAKIVAYLKENGLANTDENYALADSKV
ncbi:MAG: ATP-dependent Clp protease proteolytic subunit [Bacteroidia bacterium]|nr:ATP-dependent Clp protease proteolytic subunit [Bacteroidia bacterium]